MTNTNMLINGFGKMITERLNDGWDGHLLTFMFKPIGGSYRSINRRMEWELERVYAKSLTRIIKDSRLYSQIDKLPLWIACPDYPVPKGEADRQALRDVTINDGRHMHCVAAIPPCSRLKEDLATHLDHNQSHYVTSDCSLWRIHAVQITHDADYVNGYVFKALKRGRIVGEDILILPRSKSEM
ncbi:hypothetical protein [Microvirga antarctica]|uniref:hypothetical protein n=1 Tax=Microvirga antarctica TaxID=2819233 RepID=UPI001B312D10|nr:hypothetical protein [Microvirga antarctica]